MVTLPERVKELRQRLKLTQQQLADALGVKARTVSRWETGESQPHEVYVHRMEKMQIEQEKADEKATRAQAEAEAADDTAHEDDIPHEW